MATRGKKKQKRRERVSAKRRVDNHATGGGSNYLRTPEGYSFFDVKAKKYRLDFRSYEVGKGNPFADKGDLHYERTFWVHRDVGPNKDWHLCAAKTLGKPCPVCEYRAELARDPNSDEQMIKDLAPKERQLWLPVDLSSEGDEKLIWEFSYHLFGKQLDKKIKSGDEEDEYEFFADPEDGLTLRVVFDQSEHGKWVEATDIEFKKRREQYDAEDCGGLPCLDELLVETPYDKLKALFLQTDDAEDTDDDVDADDDNDEPKNKPKKGKKPKKEPEPEEDDDDDDVPFDDDDDDDDDGELTAEEAGLEEGDSVSYKKETCVILRVSGDGTSLILEDVDGEEVKGVGCADVKKVKPKKDKSKKSKKDKGEKGKPKKEKPNKKKPKKGKSKDGGDEEEWDDDW